MPDNQGRHRAFWLGKGLLCTLLTMWLAFCLRLLEWPCWQDPEYRLGGELLLATHDAYHWLAGAEGFGEAAGHPMALLLRLGSWLFDKPISLIAFWAPPVFASLVAGAMQILVWILGSMSAGIAAGLITSIAPGFLGRTLLGYYDTDLVTLLFPLLIILVPVAWCKNFLLSPVDAFKAWLPKKFPPAPNQAGRDPFLPASLPWIALLSLSGCLSWQAQEWHSVFPYLIRYNACLLILMCLILGPRGYVRQLLALSMCYGFPALAGLPGLVYCVIFWILRKNRPYLLQNPFLIIALSAVFLFCLLRGNMLDTLINHFNAYLKHSGDTHASGGGALVFPSVAQSIIEVQDLAIAALFPYFHPWLEAALFGICGYLVVVFKKPAALFLLPLLALAWLSSRLGGRMVMFGAPIVALGLSLPLYWLSARLFGKKRRLAGPASCLLACLIFVAPFLDMIPALCQGPSINKRHAQALLEARAITPEDATLWLWWDWGYAAHYFSRRATIADGAQHAGPSLYLPAAVFATDNPRFARQIIRYASQNGSIPGNFFRGKNQIEAQELMESLASTQTPLVQGHGRQFLITSFEMLRLGFWISNFGNWNFIDQKGEGGALSILPQGLAYNLATGEVKLEGSESIIFPISITIFEETGITKHNYIQQWLESHANASPGERSAFLASRRNINFLLNRVTDEKLAMDEGIYNSLMVRLLICNPDDPAIIPYFKLVYDNVFTRIYEIIP